MNTKPKAKKTAAETEIRCIVDNVHTSAGKLVAGDTQSLPTGEAQSLIDAKQAERV